MKLLTTSCLVSTIIFLFCLVLFNQDFGIKLIHVLWVQGVLMLGLSLALAFDTNTEENENFSIMNENIKKYNKDIPLIDK